MKFKQILDTNMVPEWRNQYLDYHNLDATLNKAIESKNMKTRRRGVNSYFELIKFNQKFANFFSRECQAQLDKIDSFHREKLTEMKGKFNNLQDQLDQVLSSAVYCEIQPHISDQKYQELNEPQLQQQQIPESSSYNTISSISDLFRNLKHSMGGRPDSPSSVDSIDSRHSETKRPISSIFPRMKQRLSLVPVLNETTRRGSHISRVGKEKIQNIARKMSCSFAQSAHRINLLRCGGPSCSSGSSSSSSNAQLVYLQVQQPRRVRPASPSRGTRISNVVIHELAATSGGDPEEFNSQNFQSYIESSPPSKSKIIASYKKKLSNLKFAFRELYFNLVVFEQYTQMNHNGFQQILRKHDRMFASTLGRKFYEEHVQTAEFYNNLQVIDHLIENLEHIYTLHFENGNRRKAIEKLQVPANVYKPSSPKQDFRVGYELGLFTVLFILVLTTGFITDTEYDWRTVFRLYRSPMLLTIFLFQTGISIVIWKHYKINHVLIFELNPRNNLSYQHFFEFGSILGIIWSISVLLFLFSDRFGLRPSICPLVVLTLSIIYLFNPTQTGHYLARFWLLKILGRIFTAPFSGRVRFADFWIADQLVSIVPLFLDLEFLLCFYTTDEVLAVAHLGPDYASRCVTRKPHDLVIRTIVAALPAWFRCVQCLRRWHDENWLRMHLANAGKYWCMVMVVVLSSISQYEKHSFELDTMRVIWILSAVFTSALTAYWDIIYDFGLFHKYDTAEQMDEESRINRSSTNSTTSFGSLCAEDFYSKKSKSKQNKRYPFLRKELVYPVWVYYFAIVENIILRFGWIITISLTEFSGIEAGLVVSLLAPMEMFRRFVWNCIRLENEQLNNCGLFRAVRDIPIEVVAPIDESHLDKVIMMMDSKDGPSMRSRLMKRRTLRPDRAAFMVLQASQPGANRCDY